MKHVQSHVSEKWHLHNYSKHVGVYSHHIQEWHIKLLQLLNEHSSKPSATFLKELHLHQYFQ